MDDGRIASPATERYLKKKEAILAAATTILNRQGVKGMTLAGVAAEVGLITTSVTYYYRKKDELAAACFMRGLERLDALVTQAARAPDAPGRLLAFLDLYLDLHRQVRGGEAAPLTSFTEIRALKDPLRGSVQGAFNDLFRRVRGFFEGPAFEHLDKRDRNARTHLLLEQVLWSGSWLRRYDTEDYGRVRDRMHDILIHGLAPNGETGSRPDWDPAALPDPTPEAPEGQDWRETFLVAATRLINQRGYRGASVEEISAQLNVTKGSFYHHHEDKDGLVVECFERTFAVIRKAQGDARRLGQGEEAGDGWDQLSAATAALVEYQLSDHGPLLRAPSMGSRPKEIRHPIAQGYNRGSERFAAMISDGIAEGSVRAVDPMIAAHMINSMLNAAASLWVWIPDIERQEAARLLARPLLTGLFTR